jgi:hypothetical protein
MSVRITIGPRPRDEYFCACGFTADSAEKMEAHMDTAHGVVPASHHREGKHRDRKGWNRGR